MLPALPVVDAAAPVVALADAEAVHRVAVVGLDDDLDKVALARAGVGHEPVEGLAPDVEGDIAESPVVDAGDVAVIPGVEGGDDAGVAGDGEAVSTGAAVVPVPVPVPGDQIRHVRAADGQGLEVVAVIGLDGDGDRIAGAKAGGRSRRNAAAGRDVGRHGVSRGHGGHISELSVNLDIIGRHCKGILPANGRDLLYNSPIVILVVHFADHIVCDGGYGHVYRFSLGSLLFVRADGSVARLGGGNTILYRLRRGHNLRESRADGDVGGAHYELVHSVRCLKLGLLTAFVLIPHVVEVIALFGSRRYDDPVAFHDGRAVHSDIAGSASNVMIRAERSCDGHIISGHSEGVLSIADGTGADSRAFFTGLIHLDAHEAAAYVRRSGESNSIIFVSVSSVTFNRDCAVRKRAIDRDGIRPLRQYASGQQR